MNENTGTEDSGRPDGKERCPACGRPTSGGKYIIPPNMPEATVMKIEYCPACMGDPLKKEADAELHVPGGIDNPQLGRTALLHRVHEKVEQRKRAEAAEKPAAPPKKPAPAAGPPPGMPKIPSLPIKIPEIKFLKDKSVVDIIFYAFLALMALSLLKGSL